MWFGLSCSRSRWQITGLFDVKIYSKTQWIWWLKPGFPVDFPMNPVNKTPAENQRESGASITKISVNFFHVLLDIGLHCSPHAPCMVFWQRFTYRMGEGKFGSVAFEIWIILDRLSLPRFFCRCSRASVWGFSTRKATEARNCDFQEWRRNRFAAALSQTADCCKTYLDEQLGLWPWYNQ